MSNQTLRMATQQHDRVRQYMMSKPKERKCPVCNAILDHGVLCEYAKCRSCGSYTYVSHKTAADDNRDFYNSVYSRTEPPRFSAVKRKLFSMYAKKDERNNLKEYSRVARLRADISGILDQGGTLMEVGFGEGKHLVKCLESGVDAHGMDISEEVVSTFCRDYPQYKERVRVGTYPEKPVGVVYCSALFEHLDDPQKFIDGLSGSLRPGGFLIIEALPVVNESQSDIGILEDISFWKPCHRIIISQRGLEDMLGGKGYTLDKCASVDLFNYRLMSLHIRHGYEDIVTIRHSCVKNGTLPGIRKYRALCREALNAKSSALVGTYVFHRQ